MSSKNDFIVIDTEGKNELNEIAIVNNRGQLIYEAFALEYDAHYEIRLNRKPLQEIINDFVHIARNKLIICHFAKHDLRVLRNSFIKVNIDWQNFKFNCTYKLARQHFSRLSSYSLEHLSKKLNLKVNNKYFNSQQAHTARYDTEFTYQLYLKIMQQQQLIEAKNKPNPFGSSRVDTPFQNHPDLTSIYQNQFTTLKTIINEIKSDFNHQTKGAVVIGEPGTGKTHLMMRLANELLEHNRLLFIRQPNNPDTVIYHTYSRILESLVEEVGQSSYTQLEYLLANSFVKLIDSYFIVSPNKKDQQILEATKDNALKLYDILGKEGTQSKRKSWEYIERITTEWWHKRYGAAGYSLEIIKGIIKFCAYSDPQYKRLVTRWLAADNLEEAELNKVGLNNWNEEMSKEAFSLEAISVLSKFSLLDEPLIVVFDQLEGLGLSHNEKLLLNFGSAIKEIFTHVPNSLIILNLFPDRWQQFQHIFDGSIIERISQNKIILEKPSPSELKQILQKKAQSVQIDIEIFTPEELNDILGQSSIRGVLNRAYEYYQVRVYGISLPKETLNNTVKAQERSITDVLQSLENKIIQLQQGFQNIAQEFKILKEFEFQVKSVENKTNSNSHYTDLESPKSQLSKKNEPKIDTAEQTGKPKIINYLEQEKERLEVKYQRPQIIEDSDDVGKLRFITEAFKSINSIEIDHLRWGKKKLPEHLLIKNKSERTCIGFLQVGSTSFTARIKNWNSLVVEHKNTNFILLRDIRQSAITGKAGKEEIAKLNHADNGEFIVIGRENRINFELIYKVIVDLQNKDLDLALETALPILNSYFQNYWLTKILL